MADWVENRSEKWINVAGVCRHWREVALMFPRLWCTIDIRQPARALMLLARSKSAPLEIRGSASKTEELMSTKTDEEVAKAVMQKIGWIQSLDLEGWQGKNILKFLYLNAPTPAPMLEHLRLVAQGHMVPRVSLPPDISQRVMPSLRPLELKNINISSGFPPLPHLRCLKFTSIQSPAIRPSALLSLIQYSPELETIEVEGVDEEDLSDYPRTRVQLWNLFKLSIMSQKIAASALLGHLDFPPSADVTFISEWRHTGNPDLSNLVEICANRFAAHSAHSIDRVQFHGGERFQLSGWCGRHRCLYISFSLERQNIPTGLLTLCLAPRLETVSTLELDRLVEMPQTQWAELFGAFKQVEVQSPSQTSLERFSPTCENVRVIIRVRSAGMMPFRTLFCLTSPGGLAQNIYKHALIESNRMFSERPVAQMSSDYEYPYVALGGC
ncbi:hypothetical protein EYR36_011612 [Pleurotus pulmonarius]|nr:hypothetical protein EYR36_011612 [Pleurotus pulmonarius]